jgi:hypothetical protein
MKVEDQVFITGTTLILEEIRVRRDDLPYPYDEAELREASTPDEAALKARELSKNYEGQPPHLGPDGVDDHRRISSLATALAERIESHYLA